MSGINSKEAKETEYWLQLLIATNILEENNFEVARLLKNVMRYAESLARLLRHAMNRELVSK